MDLSVTRLASSRPLGERSEPFLAAKRATASDFFVSLVISYLPVKIFVEPTPGVLVLLRELAPTTKRVHTNFYNNNNNNNNNFCFLEEIKLYS